MTPLIRRPTRRGALAVCVLGMHRSGTSVVARMLNLLGLDLGPEEGLMRPRPDNPRGFWEHEALTGLNDDLLARFGGTWDRPPAFPPGWERSGARDLSRRAGSLIRQEFGRSPAWAWKDPRNSLTLPLWGRLIPGLRHVVCLRHPLDVAGSLERRNAMPPAEGVALWMRYVSDSLLHTAGRPRLLVFYEDVIADVAGEMGRLAAFVGRPEAAARLDALDAAREFVSKDLRHHHSSEADALTGAPFPTAALYLMLRLHVDRDRAAGPAQRPSPDREATLDAMARAAAAAYRET